ncbi:hypothetical protein FRACYDRAFT_241920 [Fragilariopsis cylindrus CCMP1102]|uniref:MYND-type domain-containing protein n=1 Tax=Fragilariopsis cylindrus CCMP1102 TaxID=635003 RepID=A0A1E7F600_9STRA|nr:hypothetical protein FRACYDRAFT_241920 [Fragilariopsis cylindrus CCMP1102]|eukprot:OEU13580.1 hypothetical protein FRACYDRAFT_241920 [Fragilariopsis cylindrus CCMP1102]
MSSNNLNILSVEQIRSVYGIGDSREVPVHECDGPGCGKEETKQNKFKKCSRCWSKKYCSKECQKKHWKDGHDMKCEAVKVIDGGDKIVKMEVGIDDIDDTNYQRIEYFKEKYGRLIQLIALQVLLIGPNNENPDQTLYNKTHVPILFLEALPSSAKYPRLSIQTAVTLPIAMLGERYQESLYETIRLYENSKDPKSFVVNVGLSYHETGKKNATVCTPFTFGSDFLNWKGKDVHSLYERYKNTVNAMAGGNAKDLIAAIKKNA